MLSTSQTALVDGGAASQFPALPRGTATFTSFWLVGESYGAGFQSAALNINHQPYGWPAVIAKQVGLKICPPEATATDNCFALPLISFPGLGSSNELQLNDSVSPPVIVPASGTAAPMMLTFRPPDKTTLACRATPSAQRWRSRAKRPTPVSAR